MRATSTLLAVLTTLVLLAGCEVHVVHREAPPPPPPVCATCHGSGAVGCGTCGARGTVVVTSNCGACGGAGSLTCATCNGAAVFACAKCKGTGEVAELGVGKILEVKIQCNKCQGKGKLACGACGASGKIGCSSCGGSGKITTQANCGTCQGTGRIQCPTCHGNTGAQRVVVVQPPPPPPPPPPATEIVITENDEVHDVIYREYFGCSDVEIYAYPHYRRYYAVSDDDLYFITFVARRRGISFDACFHSYYYDCGRNYDRLVVTYSIPRTTFFCSVGVGVNSYPPVYQRTYVAYQQGNAANLTIQNNEYVALVHMKVAVEYQGHPPATYFAQVNAHGGNTGQVIVANRESCGKGGLTATGAKVTVTAQRPWTMPPAQKQAWHDDHKAQVVKHEGTFQEKHKEQVTRVQAQPKAAAQGNAPKNEPAGGAQKTPAQSTPGAPEPKTAHTPERPEQSAPGQKHPPGDGDPKVQKQPAGTPGQVQGEKHPQGEADPKSPKQVQGSPQGQQPPQKQAEGAKQPPQKQAEGAKQPPQKQTEGAKQPPPREEKKGKNEEQEKDKEKGK
ncbi:MAG TPA: hypothetical protein VKU80_04655 [Planctomycetota bacterium]|nr:hypothetical protein [Planctomycetota bacterium]